MNFMFFISMIIIFLSLTAGIAFTPYLTRKTECFGISVPEKEYHNYTLTSYRKNYSVISSVIGLLFVSMLIIWYAVSKTTYPFATFGIFLQLIIDFFAFFHYHNLVRHFKEKSEWKNDVESSLTIDLSNERKSYISSSWLLIFPAVIVSTIVMGFLFYGKMPRLVPMHYNTDGHVDSYARKSYFVIFYVPVMQLFMAGLFTFIFFMVKNRRRRIDPANEEESRRKSRVFRRSMEILSIVGGFIVLFIFTCLQLSMAGILSQTVSVWITVILSSALCISAVVIGLKVGQGGSRLKSRKLVPDRLNLKDSDSYWKLGIFYFNPNDPTVFVEKRFGVGYTINLGRPLAYLYIGGLVVITIAIIAICNYLTK